MSTFWIIFLAYYIASYIMLLRLVCKQKGSVKVSDMTFFLFFAIIGFFLVLVCYLAEWGVFDREVFRCKK